MDDRSPEARSKNMAKIRSSRTTPEMYVRSQLHSLGFRFRVNSNLVPGKPDLLFTKKKVVIFIHGCFWHRHPGCKFASIPKSNIEYWDQKLKRNIDRDRDTKAALNAIGFRVLIVWECTIKRMMKDDEIKNEIMKEIMNDINCGSKLVNEY